MIDTRSAAKFIGGVARETLALLPVGSLLIAAAAVASTLAPLLSRLLVDLRESSRFEPWRPLTGHLVHGSSTHLLLDLAAFVPLAAIRERRAGTGMLLVEMLALAAGVSAGIRLLHDPSMPGGIAWTSYCGLSGVVYGLAVIVLLDAGSAVATGPRAAVAAALMAKSCLEYGAGGWLASSSALEDALGVVYMPGAHCAGCAVGLYIVHASRAPAFHPSRKRLAASRGSGTSRSPPIMAAPAAPLRLRSAACRGSMPPSAKIGMDEALHACSSPSSPTGRRELVFESGRNTGE
jgi:membrane associated rhomboid family serine protease